RVALVTAGAGPQFGQGISEGLAEAGATLITASRSLETNRAFADQLRHKGFDAHPMSFDLCDLESIRQLHSNTIGRFGRLDVLVNSALARDGHVGGLQEQTPQTWLRSAQGDFAGLFLICQLFLADMVRQMKGSIINISSIYGVVANDPSLYEGTTMV